MLARVRGLRQRHYVFVDTLQGHYTGFSDDMYTPYQEWRKASYEETVALRELETEAKREMIAGGAAILAGIVAQSSGSSMTRSAGAIGVVGGGAVAAAESAATIAGRIAPISFVDVLHAAAVISGAVRTSGGRAIELRSICSIVSCAFCEAVEGGSTAAASIPHAESHAAALP